MIYNKINKQTQNHLQEIFNSFNIDFEHFYNIADTKTKNRIDVYIEEWKDKGLLNGYFGLLANNIYKRTRVKNSEILELLIYSAYIEEQSKLDEHEKQIMYEDANYYYIEGQKEVNKTLDKKKSISILDKALFLYLLAQPNAKGYVWNDYIEAITKYNAEQVFRQATIDLQQQKELDITNDIYQNLIKRQSNSRLNVNNDKISGEIDLTLIGINNEAKIEGIYSLDKKAKCKFISIEDQAQTKMCKSLNNQEFYIRDWNEFERYSKSSDSIKKYRCFGLIQGLNLPPINDGFHWCRSYIIYLPKVETQEKIQYNGLASLKLNTLQNHSKPIMLEKINYNNKEEVINCLEKYEKIIQNDNIENAIVVTRDGEVYQCYGSNNSVWPDYDLKEQLREAYVTHNHPKNETEYSFSESDIELFNTYNLKILRGKDYKYTYELNRNKNDVDTIDIFNMTDEDGIHALNINRAEKYGIGYRRWKND